MMHRWCNLRVHFCIKSTERKEKEIKKRLILYSSQDSNSSIESTTSRRSGRKRTGVIKMGGGES